MNEIEQTIMDRINSKREVVEKVAKKKENTLKQIEICESSVEMMERKILNTKMQIGVCQSAVEETDKELTAKNEELNHMSEILERYRLGEDERLEISNRMVAIQKNVPDWTPGDPLEMQRDKVLGANAEYQALLSRKKILDDVVANAVSDVNKIYYNRGDVSASNRRA